MTAAEYLSRSRLFRRLKSGPNGQLVELYAARLVKDGLARQGTWRSFSLFDDLMSWVASACSKLTDLDEEMAERYLRHRAGRQSIQPGDRAALKRLLSVLREAGTIAPAAQPPLTLHEQIFEAFSRLSADGTRSGDEVNRPPFAFHSPVPARGVPCRRLRPRQDQPGERHALHRASCPGLERGDRKGDVLGATLISPVSPS